MAVLATSGVTLPKNIAEGMWKKAQGGSAIAALSQADPQQFGEVTHVTLTGRPRAELVGEGAQKGDTNATFGTKIATPHKFQVTMRFNEEVQWAGEAYQLGILSTLAETGGEALARALDLGGFHGINPRAGTASSLIVAGDRIGTTTNQVELTTASLLTPDLVIEQAAGLVIADGYIPNGIAFDPSYAWTTATSRYADGRKKFPELGYGSNVSSFEGLPAFSSSTVSGLPEASVDSKIKAIVGQWDAFRWGVQKDVPVRMYTTGDPDGLGDLARLNQIALRLEVVYAWAVMDLDAFGLVVDKVTNV
jgi:hypothetical protein